MAPPYVPTSQELAILAIISHLATLNVEKYLQIQQQTAQQAAELTATTATESTFDSPDAATNSESLSAVAQHQAPEAVNAVPTNDAVVSSPTVEPGSHATVAQELDPEAEAWNYISDAIRRTVPPIPNAVITPIPVVSQQAGHSGPRSRADRRRAAEQAIQWNAYQPRFMVFGPTRHRFWEPVRRAEEMQLDMNGETLHDEEEEDEEEEDYEEEGEEEEEEGGEVEVEGGILAYDVTGTANMRAAIAAEDRQSQEELRAMNAATARAAVDAMPRLPIEDNDLCCHICSMEYDGTNSSEEPEVPVQTSCQHVFGSLCLARWLSENESCPMCRAQLVRLNRSGGW